jgi:hypothetical protein
LSLSFCLTLAVEWVCMSWRDVFWCANSPLGETRGNVTQEHVNQFFHFLTISSSSKSP